ncbi:uncharacterized protein LOC124407383 [Diprion similis]|uniref:uncharacterized protein LOC124407383 n=1 Tax=Diprion similis TaxID=362088 RepID=UPI001EF8EC93|nr:uncharacterized protein LOC124407383 [Diprion similis]
MSERNLTAVIWIFWIILRECADVGCTNETRQNNTWREWDFSPSNRKCVYLKLDNRSSSANLNQINQCDYEPKSSEPPSWLQHQRSTLSPNFPGIDWNVSMPRENFQLILLAIPHVKNKKECACDPRENVNLLQNIPNAKDSSMSIKKDVPASSTFIDIFTGCYYFVMRNEKKKSWLWGPYFYNTTHPVHDPTLKCHYEDVSNVAIETSRILPFTITVPTTCMELNLMLWEIDKEKSTKEGDFDMSTSRPSQICHVNMVANLTFRCQYNDTDLTLSWPMEHKYSTDGAWSVKVVWKGLKEGDVCYSPEFSQTNMPNVLNCSEFQLDFRQWKNYATFGKIKLSCYNKAKIPEAGWNLHELALTSVAVLLVSILLFWMFKFFRIRRRGRNVENDVTFNTINPLLYKEKPNRILIIYTKGPSSFIEEMRSFRDKLEERCDCPVYDLQSDEDSDLNVELGSNEWIDRLLKHGCKVIWVDTPQFRLLVENDESRIKLYEDYAVDFRDTAIPFALATAKTLYQDPITQYRDHFIVRWNGFEVTDGPDDPLAVISPHTRFRLPEHFDELCSHL